MYGRALAPPAPPAPAAPPAPHFVFLIKVTVRRILFKFGRFRQ